MNKASYRTTDEYLEMFKFDERNVLENLRQIIKEIVPEATEIISYNMPAFKYQGSVLVYFAACKNHCGFYPGSGNTVAQLSEELKDYKTTKGSIHFPYNKPLPKALIKKVVLLRIKENIEKELQKTNKKKK
ncbi:MAG: iron chaperone [Bacteroidia bacterium]